MAEREYWSFSGLRMLKGEERQKGGGGLLALPETCVEAARIGTTASAASS